MIYIREARCFDQLFSPLASPRKAEVPKKDIIRLAGISESTYRKLLAGESVRMDVLERICLALGVDIGDVCSFKG